ncbi:MAG: T9SS type A sorting domain-containing protein [Chlorobi bacterium]|nr:T9SS type A sorting domain-containing protein [Chlorobiota bacterium]
MKTFTNALLLVLISNISFAQGPRNEGDGYLLDSVYKYSKNWYEIEVVQKEYYYYNLLNQIKLIKSFKNKTGFPDPAEWYWTEKENYYYDDQNRLKSDIFSKRDFDETDWTYDHKYEYEYSDIMQSQASAYWDLTVNNWMNGMKEIDSIKQPEDMEESFLRQFWNEEAGEWQNELWFDTLYRDNGLIDSIVFTNYYLDSNVTIYYNLYDYTFYPDTLFIYEYGSSPNVYYHKIFYTEDSSMKYEYLIRINDDGSHEKMHRETEAFNDQHWLVQRTSALWSNTYQEWMILYKDSLIYNELGLVIRFNQCMPDQRRTDFEYNDENLLKRKKYYFSMPDTTLYRRWDYFYTYTYVDVPESVSGTTGRILLYPNPARENIYFNNIKTKNQGLSYQIFDLTGKPIRSGRIKAEDNHINIENLIPGNYLIRISVKNKMWTGRFIKY